MAVLIPYSVREGILAGITGTGGVLEAPVSVELYQSPVSLGTRTTYAEMLAAIATFDGYTAKTISAWSAQYRDGADNVYQDGGELLWVRTVTGSPQTIYGAYWHETTNLLGVEEFPVPIVVEFADDPVIYLPVFAYGQ